MEDKFRLIQYIKDHGYIDIDVLLEYLKSDIDLNLKNSDGETALMLAAKGQHVKAVKVLIKAGADINITDNLNKTVFDHANWVLSKKICKILTKQRIKKIRRKKYTPQVINDKYVSFAVRAKKCLICKKTMVAKLFSFITEPPFFSIKEQMTQDAQMKRAGFVYAGHGGIVCKECEEAEKHS